MTTKFTCDTDTDADTDATATTAIDRDQRQRPATASPAPLATLTEPANADVWFFDGALAYAFGHGVGSVTLTNRRQLVNGSGQVFEDTVIAGLLRAPLPSLLHLRQVIDEIEKLAKRAASAEPETLGRFPH